METVGCANARREYTHTVVLCWAFWLQSTNTFPLRTDFFISDTTSSGWRRSSSWASPCANSRVCGYVTGVLSGT